MARRALDAAAGVRAPASSRRPDRVPSHSAHDGSVTRSTRSRSSVAGRRAPSSSRSNLNRRAPPSFAHEGRRLAPTSAPQSGSRDRGREPVLRARARAGTAGARHRAAGRGATSSSRHADRRRARSDRKSRARRPPGAGGGGCARGAHGVDYWGRGRAGYRGTSRRRRDRGRPRPV